MSFGTILFAIIAFLFGLYEIGYGMFAYRLNHFKFYVTAGFLIGIPFLIISVYLILRPGRPAMGWEPLIFIAWAFGVAWKAWHKRVARRMYPLQWDRWEQTMDSWRDHQPK